MSFRPATADDEEFFWEWRKAAEISGTLGGWWDGNPCDEETHKVWYEERLGKTTLLVWEDEEQPTGCVRIDSNGEVTFHAPDDIAVEMLENIHDLAIAYGGRLKATIDEGDPRADVLAAAGFVEALPPVRFFTYRP